MSVPGAGLLAALRRKNKASAEATPDQAESMFAASSAAVEAMEHAVAAGATPEPAKQAAARGCAIPPGGEFVYHLDAPHPGEACPELAYTPVTRVPTEYTEAHLRQVAVSSEFITYGLKQGHIRALHKYSDARALLKGHADRLADIEFLDSEVVAAGGQDGQLYVWQIKEVEGDNALHVSQLLHATFAPGCDAQPVLLASGGDRASLVAAVGNAVLALTVPDEGGAAVEIDPLSPAPPTYKMPNFPAADKPSAVAVSADGVLVAAGGKSGRVYVCQRESGRLGEIPGGNSIAPRASAVSAVAWLDAGEAQGHVLLVASEDGAELALFHLAPGAEAFTAGASVRIQAGGGKVAGPVPFIHVGVVHEQQLVLLADTRRDALYTLHWSGSGSGAALAFDYLARFGVGKPILNFSAMWNPTARDEGAVEVTCVHPDAVQQYYVDPEMCYDEGGAASPETTPAPKTTPAPAQPAEQAQPQAQPSAALPLPSPALANGEPSAEPAPAASNGAGAVESPPEAKQTTPPPAPVAVPTPPPATLPSPTPSPRLLTPKDLLKMLPTTAAAAPAAAEPERTSSSPAPGSQPQPSPKILRRPAPAQEPAAQPAAAPEPASPASDAGAVSAAVAEEMSGVHRKFAAHVSAMQRELLKAMKAELSAQAAAQQAANAELLRQAMAAQAAAVAAERAAVLAEERAGMERLLAAISATLNRDLPSKLQEGVRAELAAAGAAIAASVAPAVQAALAASLPKDVGASVSAALEKQLPAAIQSGLAKPLGESFRAAFSKQIIPAFEGAVQTMFKQVNASLATGLQEHLAATRAALTEPAALTSSLRDSLGAASALAESLRKGQEGLLRSASISSAASGARSPAPAPVDVRAELKSLAKAGRFEEAFSRALGLQDVSTVSWLCAQADAASVLSRDPPALSQMVLLSLIQQLASDLGSGVATKLQWIREAAMVLDPKDAQTAPHLRPVLEQVTSALQAAVGKLKGADASSCKLAMHVVHSQMTS